MTTFILIIFTHEKAAYPKTSPNSEACDCRVDTWRPVFEYPGDQVQSELGVQGVVFDETSLDLKQNIYL